MLVDVFTRVVDSVSAPSDFTTRAVQASACLEVCKRLRAFGNPAVLMLTAKEALTDRVSALESGAGYEVKPFQFETLVARIRAILRRRNERMLGSTARFADHKLDPITREVSRFVAPGRAHAARFRPPETAHGAAAMCLFEARDHRARVRIRLCR